MAAKIPPAFHWAERPHAIAGPRTKKIRTRSIHMATLQCSAKLTIPSDAAQ